MRREKLPKQITVLSLIWLSQSHADPISGKMLRRRKEGGGERERWEMPQKRSTMERGEKMRKMKSKDKRERQWREDQREEEEERVVLRTKIDQMRKLTNRICVCVCVFVCACVCLFVCVWFIAAIIR